jgi:hypothetical protein
MNTIDSSARIFLCSQSADEIMILENVNNLEMQFLIVENCISKLSLHINKINYLMDELN